MSVLSLFGRFNFYLFRKINTNTFSELYCKYGKILFAPVSSPKSEWHKMKQYPVQTPKLTRTNLEIKSLKEECNTTFSISWNFEDWNWFNSGKNCMPTATQQQDLIVQVSGQNLPIYFHKHKLWLFKFDNNDYHGHSND